MFLMIVTPLAPMANATNSRSIQMSGNIGWEDTVETVIIMDMGDDGTQTNWSGTFHRTLENWVAISQSSAIVDSPYHTYVDSNWNKSLIVYDDGSGNSGNWSIINTNVVMNPYFSDMCDLNNGGGGVTFVAPTLANSYCISDGMYEGQLTIFQGNETFPEVVINIDGLSSSSEYQVSWSLWDCDTGSADTGGGSTFTGLSSYSKDYSFHNKLAGDWYFFYELNEIFQSGSYTYISNFSTSCTGSPPSGGGTSTPTPTVINTQISSADPITGLISATTFLNNLSAGESYIIVDKVTSFSSNSCDYNNTLRMSNNQNMTMDSEHNVNTLISWLSSGFGGNSSGLYSPPSGGYLTNQPMELEAGTIYCYIFQIHKDGNVIVSSPTTFTTGSGYGSGNACPEVKICWNYDTYGLGSSFSQDGTWVTYDGPGVGETIAHTPIPSEGKWYWEYEILRNSGSFGNMVIVGVSTGDALNEVNETFPYSGIGTDNYGWGIDSWGSVYHSAKTASPGCSTHECWDTETDVTIGIAIDMDSGTMWYSKNGVWPGNTGGDPSFGAIPIFGTHEGVTAVWDTQEGSSNLEPNDLGDSQLYPAISVTGSTTSHSIRLLTGDNVEQGAPPGFDVLGESELEITTSLYWENEEQNGVDEPMLKLEMNFPEGEDSLPPFPGIHNIIMNLTVKNDQDIEMYSDYSTWEDMNLSETTGLQKWYEQIHEFPSGWNHYCADVIFEDNVTGEDVAFGNTCEYLNVDEMGLDEDCSYISSSDYLMVTESYADGGTMNGRYERHIGWATEGDGDNDVIPEDDALYWRQTLDSNNNPFSAWTFYNSPDPTGSGDIWTALKDTNPPADTEGSSVVYTSDWGDDPCHPEGDGDLYGTVTHYSESSSSDSYVYGDLFWNPNEGKLDINAHAYSDLTNQVVIAMSVDSFDHDIETDFSHAQDSGTLALDENDRVTFSNVMDLYSLGLVPDHTYCVTFSLGDRSDGDDQIASSISCMFFGDDYAIDSSTVEWSSDVSTWVSETSSSQMGSESSNIIDSNLETFWETEESCETENQYVHIDLQGSMDISGVSLHWGDEFNQPLEYEIWAHIDGGEWITVFDISLQNEKIYGTIHHVFPKINTDLIKITCTDSAGSSISLHEIEVHPWSSNFNPNENLVGYWNFDEPVETTVFSDVLNNNHGQIYGGAELGHPARFGNGIELLGYADSGSDGYVATAPSPFSEGTDEFTLSMWVKLDTHDVNAGGIFSFGFEPDNSDSAFYLVLQNNRLEIVQDDTVYLTFEDFGTDAYLLNEWNNFVLTGTASESNGRWFDLELFVNGISENIGYLPLGMGVNWNLYFGSESTGNVIDGKIDEVRLYDIALDSENIDLLYHNAANFANGGNNNGGNNGAFNGINFETDLTNEASVFASSAQDSAEDAIDDSSETSWSSDGDCPQDIMIDLDNEYDVAAIKIVWGLLSNPNSNFHFEIETWNPQNGWMMQQSHSTENPPSNQESTMYLVYPQSIEKILIKCKYYEGNVRISEIEVYEANADWHSFDFDSDNVQNGNDGCFNGLSGWIQDSQTDYDGDGCHDDLEDGDDDNDGIPDESDSCYKGALNWNSWGNNPVIDYDHDGCHDDLEDGDDDNDGISDESDSCSSTRLGAGVNALGCETSFEDIDLDGVADSYDTCPNTPTDTEVDMFSGCPLYPDTDGDGVNDNEDAYPNDPTEQFDTDQDGIGDNADLCNNSLPGDLVDLTGCLVNNQNNNNETTNLTACEEWELFNPNLVNASLPGNGCPDYVLEDTDGDGVNDFDSEGEILDTCPDTEEGIEVDEFGCSAYAFLPPALASVLDFILNIDSLIGLPDGTLEIMFAALGMMFGVLRFAGKRTLAGKTRRVEKYASEIRMARTRRELENLEKRIAKDNNKKLLPPGGFGDLMELIEMRAIELGEMDMAVQVRDTVAEEESMKDSHERMLEEMEGTREAVAGLQDELSEIRKKGPPGKGRGGRKGPPRRGKNDSGYKIKESGGPRRPSLHPADLDGDGFVTDEEKKVYRERKEQEDGLWEYD